MFRHILVPLDQSAYAERALSYAQGIAKLAGASIGLVVALSRLGPAEMTDLVKFDQLAEQRAERYLEKRAAAVRAAGTVDVRTEIRFGEPATVIVDLARETGADLIVMTSHGMGAARRYALGSVALKVVSTAPCPVFVVRIVEEISGAAA